MPHGEAEERILYPQVASLLGSPEATAAMAHDHAVIREHAVALSGTAPRNVGLLQELLFGLYAVTVAHIRKEEELYLPLLEERPAEIVKLRGERQAG